MGRWSTRSLTVDHRRRGARRCRFAVTAAFSIALGGLAIDRPIGAEELPANDSSGRTTVSIDGPAFLINGRPTYAGRRWRGQMVEGLLLNSRMVQAIFDDLNPATRDRWAYPDSGEWDADRNTAEFIAAMPAWRAAGLLAITLNLQGGSPEGYSRDQPWENSAIAPDGSLRPKSMERLQRVIDRADELGMVVILGLFYFGQDQRIQDEAAVLAAIDQTLDWLAERSYRNVLIEVNNECDIQYDHPLLQPAGVPALIARIKAHPGRFYASTSFGGGTVPSQEVIRSSDFVLLHANGVDDPAEIRAMVEGVRSSPAYRPMPILFNEDDHYAFDAADNNFVAAIEVYSGWGYFDFRRPNESFADGYQSLPVDWTISSPRKQAFFQLLNEIAGSETVPAGGGRSPANRPAVEPAR
jgi:hypothetical protein